MDIKAVLLSVKDLMKTDRFMIVMIGDAHGPFFSDRRGRGCSSETRILLKEFGESSMVFSGSFD